MNAPIPETITYGFGRLFTDEKGSTVYADCHGLNKAVYQKRQNRKPYWGQLREAVEEDEDESMEEEEEEEEEEPEYEGIGRNNLGMLDEDMYAEEEAPKQDQKTSFDDLKAGISSLIQNTQQNLLTPDVDIKRTVNPKMPPPPTEPRSLYAIVEEVKHKVGDSSDIF